MLSGKYVQYQKIGIGYYIIIIVPQKVITWMTIMSDCGDGTDCGDNNGG